MSLLPGENGSSLLFGAKSESLECIHGDCDGDRRNYACMRTCMYVRTSSGYLSRMLIEPPEQLWLCLLNHPPISLEFWATYLCWRLEHRYMHSMRGGLFSLVISWFEICATYLDSSFESSLLPWVLIGACAHSEEFWCVCVYTHYEGFLYVRLCRHRSSDRLWYVYVCTYTHIRIHTYTYTYTFTYKHRRGRTHTHSHTHTCTCTYTYTYAFTYTYTYT